MIFFTSIRNLSRINYDRVKIIGNQYGCQKCIFSFPSLPLTSPGSVSANKNLGALRVTSVCLVVKKTLAGAYISDFENNKESGTL